LFAILFTKLPHINGDKGSRFTDIKHYMLTIKTKDKKHLLQINLNQQRSSKKDRFIFVLRKQNWIKKTKALYYEHFKTIETMNLGLVLFN
jgi:hypothetical protein